MVRAVPETTGRVIRKSPQAVTLGGFPYFNFGRFKGSNGLSAESFDGGQVLLVDFDGFGGAGVGGACFPFQFVAKVVQSELDFRAAIVQRVGQLEVFFFGNG